MREAGTAGRTATGGVIAKTSSFLTDSRVGGRRGRATVVPAVGPDFDVHSGGGTLGARSRRPPTPTLDPARK